MRADKFEEEAAENMPPDVKPSKYLTEILNYQLNTVCWKELINKIIQHLQKTVLFPLLIHLQYLCAQHRSTFLTLDSERTPENMKHTNNRIYC